MGYSTHSQTPHLQIAQATGLWTTSFTKTAKRCAEFLPTCDQVKSHSAKQEGILSMTCWKSRVMNHPVYDGSGVVPWTFATYKANNMSFNRTRGWSGAWFAEYIREQTTKSSRTLERNSKIARPCDLYRTPFYASISLFSDDLSILYRKHAWLQRGSGALNPSAYSNLGRLSYNQAIYNTIVTSFNHSKGIIKFSTKKNIFNY